MDLTLASGVISYFDMLPASDAVAGLSRHVSNSVVDWYSEDL